MKFHFAHTNFHVADLQKSLEFYDKALGLKELRRKETAGGDLTLVFLGDESTTHQLELTHSKKKQGRYNLGDNEFHLAFAVDDLESARALHKEMDCICYEKEPGGLYFINDPDGYWIEIMPK